MNDTKEITEKQELIKNTSYYLCSIAKFSIDPNIPPEKRKIYNDTYLPIELGLSKEDLDIILLNLKNNGFECCYVYNYSQLYHKIYFNRSEPPKEEIDNFKILEKSRENIKLIPKKSIDTEYYEHMGLMAIFLCGVIIGILLGVSL